MKKSEIIEQLTTWSQDILFDINSDWAEEAQKQEWKLQLFKIQIALSNIQSIGPNDNIKE